MGDDSLHALVVGVGCGGRLGEHGSGVEDVEAFVLHRAHVEVADGDDVVHVEVILAPVSVLVPPALHGIEPLAVSSCTREVVGRRLLIPSGAYFMLCLRDSMLHSSWSTLSYSDQTAKRTSRPDDVVNVDSIPPRSPATQQKRYDGLRNGSVKLAQWRPLSSSP